MTKTALAVACLALLVAVGAVSTTAAGRRSAATLLMRSTAALQRGEGSSENVTTIDPLLPLEDGEREQLLCKTSRCCRLAPMTPPALPPKDDQPLLETEEGKVRVLAYGANMLYRTMDRRGVTVLDSAPVVLQEYCLVFDTTFGWHTTGDRVFGNLKHLPGTQTCVHGVALLMSEADFHKLSGFEKEYKVLDVIGHTYDGKRVAMKAYEAPHGEQQFPSFRYASILFQGALRNKVCSSYIDMLRILVDESELPLGGN
eukprot:PLAT15644.1.p1 GENE.PLAT15644.1~~PLAT15644.1.p1  ORF type:complete len:267 (+),score=92.48 PLAT15644.1:33-803(+)